MADAGRRRKEPLTPLALRARVVQAIYALGACYHSGKAALGVKSQMLERLARETKLDLPSLSLFINGKRGWAGPQKRALLLAWYAKRQREQSRRRTSPPGTRSQGPGTAAQRAIRADSTGER